MLAVRFKFSENVFDALVPPSFAFDSSQNFGTIAFIWDVPQSASVVDTFLRDVVQNNFFIYTAANVGVAQVVPRIYNVLIPIGDSDEINR